jgi:hypothetical protein
MWRRHLYYTLGIVLTGFARGRGGQEHTSRIAVRSFASAMRSSLACAAYRCGRTSFSIASRTRDRKSCAFRMSGRTIGASYLGRIGNSARSQDDSVRSFRPSLLICNRWIESSACRLFNHRSPGRVVQECVAIDTTDERSRRLLVKAPATVPRLGFLFAHLKRRRRREPCDHDQR